jgi:hypothetical protein
MPKYQVIKKLELCFECEAISAAEAEGMYIEADERSMSLVDCQYNVSLLEHMQTGWTPEKLRSYYANGGSVGHPEFPEETWQQAVSQKETIRGYWEWVAAQSEESNYEPDEDE